LPSELAWGECVEHSRRDFAHLDEVGLAISPTELMELANTGACHEEGRPAVVLRRRDLDVSGLEPSDGPGIFARSAASFASQFGRSPWRQASR
jgi:hypothetical protein